MFEDELQRANERPQTVPFLDGRAGRVIRKPESELKPGTTQVQLQETYEVLWDLSELDEGVREHIRLIQIAVSLLWPKSLEEWEDRLARESLIAFWWRAVGTYMAFAANEPIAERRKDVYDCIFACMTTGPDGVWCFLRPKVLSRNEAQQVVNRFFGKQT